MSQDGSRVDDEPTIRAVVDSIDDTSDRKEWGACRELFADSVHIDFGSLTGGEPSSVPADALIAGWRENLHEAKRTFHLRSHHRIEVEGDTATCVSHGYALNVLPGDVEDDLWEAWGWYTHSLRRSAGGWRCTGMTIDVLHTRGNSAAVVRGRQ